jgi:uncharacterized RDD family membrane protein YckC
VDVEQDDLEYVGFWPRVGASLIDSLLLVLVTAPLLYAIYGSAYWQDGRVIHGAADVLISWILPAVAIILFWIYRQATPGKMAIGARPSSSRGVGPVGAYCQWLPEPKAS